MERCTRCVLPKSLIRCSPEGICALCQDDDGKLKYKGEEALAALLEQARADAKAQGAEFDCLCAISGGKDSMYALHQLVTRYRMRVLAFTYNHGYMDEQAWRNIETAVAAFQVPLVRHEDTGLQRKYLKHNLRALAHQPPASLAVLTPLLCVGCSVGYVKGANRLARERRIPVIVQGGAPVEPDVKYLYDPHTSYTLNVVLRPLLQVPAHGVLCNPLYPRNALYHVSALQEYLGSCFGRFLPRASGPARCQFFSFVEYDESRIVSTLENELGWRRPPGRSSTTRFDCKVHWLRDIFYHKALGITDKDVVYAAMVRKQLISRDEALRRVEVEEREEEALRDEVVVDVLRRLDRMDLLDRLRALYHP